MRSARRLRLLGFDQLRIGAFGLGKPCPRPRQARLAVRERDGVRVAHALDRREAFATQADENDVALGDDQRLLEQQRVGVALALRNRLLQMGQVSRWLS